MIFDVKTIESLVRNALRTGTRPQPALYRRSRYAQGRPEYASTRYPECKVFGPELELKCRSDAGRPLLVAKTLYGLRTVQRSEYRWPKHPTAH
jgi:hypothetical protein